ncbi:LOW QUALITY PROTEIN: hypothetical protein ACHAW6_001080, partial [Cyclotella cf. meneghiniana]
MIFDVKMEDFCCKARLVAGGHMTKAPATLTYANIMSQETKHIAILVAVLNNVDTWATDVLNAYIPMPCCEKIWTTLRKEFGLRLERLNSLSTYGLNSSGAAFRGHLASFLLLQLDSIHPPEMYLGAKLKKKTFEDGNVAWGLSPSKYVQQA